MTLITPVPFTKRRGLSSRRPGYSLLERGTSKKVRAFDVDSGEILLERKVGAAVQSIPAVYEWDGRQYVVFCASGQVGLTRDTEVKIDGAYVAFALP